MSFSQCFHEREHKGVALFCETAVIFMQCLINNCNGLPGIFLTLLSLAAAAVANTFHFTEVNYEQGELLISSSHN